MAGKRQPVDVLLANGRKHMSRAEEQERRTGELHVDPPEEATPPKWLKKKLHQEFQELGERLIPLGLYSDLDQDVLAQFLICRDRWKSADALAEKAIRAKDEKLAKEWTNVQSAYFRQCRQCAEAMGLSVSSRCKLVIPQSQDEGEDEFTAFLNRNRNRAADGR